VAVTTATATMDFGFNAHLRPDVNTSYDGDCVLALAYDTLIQRLVVGTGGGTENSLRVLHPFTGDEMARWNSEGDVQAVAVTDVDYVAGYHRSHGNLSAPPTPWFAYARNRFAGWLEAWNPGLTGGSSLSGPTGDSSNGGVTAALFDNGRLYLGGGFTTPTRGLAVYQ
jgi:hypothetical protein